MVVLFIALTALNLLFLGTAMGLAYLGRGHPLGHWHVLIGALAGIVCCGVHSVVFTYFIATAKWIQHAVAVKQLNPALVAPTRSFKAQAFPAALLAIATVLAAAFSGAATDNRMLSPGWHHVLAWLALVANALVAVVEYRAIVRNGALVDRVLEQIVPEA
jgi:hypothetical protein